MKKLMLILSIFGLFALVSCDNPDANTTTNSNPDTTQTNPSESSPSNTEEESKDDSTSGQTNNKDNEPTIPDYDDGIDWEGTID